MKAALLVQFNMQEFNLSMFKADEDGYVVLSYNGTELFTSCVIPLEEAGIEYAALCMTLKECAHTMLDATKRQ